MKKADLLADVTVAIIPNGTLPCKGLTEAHAYRGADMHLCPSRHPRPSFIPLMSCCNEEDQRLVTGNYTIMGTANYFEGGAYGRRNDRL